MVRFSQIVTPARGGRLAGVLLLAALAAGCGGRDIYPVRGQLVDEAGQSITGMQDGNVEFDCIDAPSSATGTISEDGTFVLTTEKANDGAHVGKHRVKIIRRYISPERQA